MKPLLNVAIHCEFIDLIIPISKIDEVHPGGFTEFKKDNLEIFSRRMWHDEFLFRDGAMGGEEIKAKCDLWESRRLQAFIEIDGKLHWKDFCVVESLLSGPTLPCDWIEFDRERLCVSLKGHPPGEIIGSVR